MCKLDHPLIARFMGPTWGPSGADRTQVGPMLAPWPLLSGITITADAFTPFVGKISSAMTLVISILVSNDKSCDISAWRNAIKCKWISMMSKKYFIPSRFKCLSHVKVIPWEAIMGRYASFPDKLSGRVWSKGVPWLQFLYLYLINTSLNGSRASIH